MGGLPESGEHVWDARPASESLREGRPTERATQCVPATRQHLCQVGKTGSWLFVIIGFK